MKWNEVRTLPQGSHIKRLGSGKKAVFLGIIEPNVAIKVRFVGTREIFRANPSEFDRDYSTSSGTLKRQ